MHLKKLLPLYLVIFVGFIGYSIIITVLTPILIDDYHLFFSSTTSLSYRTILLGILLAVYPFGQFLGAPVIGSFSDHFGRKPLLVFSLVLTVLFYVGICLSMELHSIWHLMLFIFLAGLFESNINVAQSAIADVCSEELRSRFFGYVFLSTSLAFVIGPLIGGKLAAWISYSAPFWFTLILLVVVLLFVITRFDETLLDRSKGRINYIKAFTNIASIFHVSPLRKLYFINFLLYLAIFGFFRCYPMYLVNEFNLDVSRVSEFIAWVAVPIILSNLWLTSFLTKHFHPRKLAACFGILTGIFMIVVVVIPFLQSLWITLFFTALAIGICLPSSITNLSIVINQDMQGRVLGNNQSLLSGSEALSAFVGGLLASIFFQLPLIILGIIALLAGFMLFKGSNSIEHVASDEI